MMNRFLNRVLPRRSSRWRIGADLSNKTAQHQFQLTDAAFQYFVLGRSQQLEVAAQQQEVVQFARRTQRQMKKLSQLDFSRPAASFSDVGGYGIRSAPHLTGQSISLLLRKSKSRSVNAERHCMAFLPDQQLSKILHSFTSFPSAHSVFTHNLILITYNSSRGIFRCS